MNDIDRQIRDALGPEHSAVLESPGEGERVDEQILSAFRSRNRAWTIFSVCLSLAFVGLGVYCVAAFFDAADTKHQIAFGLGAVLCMLVITTTKIWFWLEMHRLAVTREVKRIELLTACLIRRLDERDADAG